VAHHTGVIGDGRAAIVGARTRVVSVDFAVLFCPTKGELVVRDALAC
jgi:hypothetical protein